LETNDGGQLQFRPSEVLPGIRNIIRQGSIYSITKVLLLMFSIVTFPIFTRVLSKEEYGLMHTITIVLMMVSLICSGDLKDAILRFYGECERKNELRLLISNTFTGSLLMAVVGYLLTVLVAFVMFKFGIISNDVFKLILISFLAIIAGNIVVPIQAFYRVREEALKYNAVSLISKLITTGLCITFVVYLSKGLYGLFVGQIIGEGLIAATLFIIFMKQYGFGTLSLSFHHLKIFLKYSSPLIVNGIFAYLTNFGDRFLIAMYLGQASVATYAVAYALPDYIQTAVILSLNMVLYPVIMNLWGKGKDKEAEVMLSNFLIIYVVIAIPVVFGLISLRYEIIEVLASKKYFQAAELITVLTLGMMIRGLEFPLAAGLYRVKRTDLIALLNMGGVIVNVGLNVILIPILSLQGAAFATLGSYLAILFVSYRLSSKYQKITINLREVMKFTAISMSISAVMFVAVNFINLKPLGLIYDLSCKIVVGIFIYCFGLFVFVKKIAKSDKKVGL
jgi:O-antigen/teichoic acid export membrane protein